VTAASELSQLLGSLADSLERQSQTFSAGYVRQAARLLIEQDVALRWYRAPSADACQRCGGDVRQDGRGRPRLYCEACSPKKKPENATLSSEVNR
jgi:hypothetical protein